RNVPALIPTHGVELVAQTIPGAGDPLAQHAPTALVAGMTVAGRGDRLASLGQIGGRGDGRGGPEHDGENPAHAGILPACTPKAPPSDRGPAPGPSGQPPLAPGVREK